MSALQITAALPTRRFSAHRICIECGCPFLPVRAHGEFCEAACRKAFNNRRLVRGAELYDLFMALRYDRGVAKTLKVWRLICRMASAFRAEDVAQRDGRRSWADPAEIIARRPYLEATVIVRGRRS